MKEGKKNYYRTLSISAVNRSRQQLLFIPFLSSMTEAEEMTLLNLSKSDDRPTSSASYSNYNDHVVVVAANNVDILDRLNDVNIVVVTDVHSWVAGHGRHEPYYLNNADYGDILSWYQHLQQAIVVSASNRKKDAFLFFVNNGDIVDGTGLTQVPEPRRLLPILQHIPFSAVNLGNHEIYRNETIAYMQSSGFIRHWNGTYLTSNTVWADTGEPVGDRYTYWKCQQQQQQQQQPQHDNQQADASKNVLVFGFLFDFQQFCQNVRVETVQDTIRQAWFQNVLQQEGSSDGAIKSFQAIVVLAHMGYNDPLVDILLRAMRDRVGPDMPIQFINGHTHERGFRVLDPHASAFEAGRFLDTIGFISFPLLSSLDKKHQHPSSTATIDGPRKQHASSWLDQPTVTTNTSSSSSAAAAAFVFRPVFLDTNTKVLAQALGANDENVLFKTPDGKDLSRLIYDTRVSLGLTRVVGCSNTTYLLDYNSSTDSSSSSFSSSLWALYMNQVVPSVLLEYNASKVFVQSTGAFRDNLYLGNVTVDDLIDTSPWDDAIYNVANRISGTDLIQVLQILGASNTNPVLPNLPQIAVSSSIGMTSCNCLTSAAGESSRLVPDQWYDLYTCEWDASYITPVVANVTGRQSDDYTPVLYVQNEHDKAPRIWTTGRVWREYVAKEWPCSTTTNTGHAVSNPPGRLLAPLALVAFLAWVLYLVKFQKRLSSLPQTTTLDSSGSETTRLMDDNDGETSVIRVYDST